MSYQATTCPPTASSPCMHTEELAWYFQFTPHDEHDRDATQAPILTDILINEALRRVLCVAKRNGFNYVLDRATSEFLVGVPFVEQNIAQGLDSTGRPILTSHAELTSAGRLTKPGSGGSINWQNAAFDDKSRLVFVPATEGQRYSRSPRCQGVATWDSTLVGRARRTTMTNGLWYED